MPIEAWLILDSYQHFLGKSCIALTSSKTAAQILYEAPFAVVAHDT
ncbi:MAG: MEKHLA domain-containing protein, partial [Burkholderiaceae bacterium]|nr:MEKHLA domain-containing protein [Burkholderiaceae bacterium]